MKTGTTSITLETVWAFSDEGDADLDSVRIGNRVLPRQLANRLLDWLGAKSQQVLVDEAWENAGGENTKVAS